MVEKKTLPSFPEFLQQRRRFTYLVSLFLYFLLLQPSTKAFSSPLSLPKHSRIGPHIDNSIDPRRVLHRICLASSAQSKPEGTPEEEPDEQEKLLNRASKLREEADVLEAKMKETRKIRADGAAPSYTPPQAFDKLADSTWMISYRFTKEPRSDDDTNVPKYYSGKVGVRFRSDGYTDLLNLDDDEVRSITFEKFWGWDEEISNEDGFKYLIFSADVKLDDDSKDKFYFQARVDMGPNRKEIKLSDGTVTVKKDVERTSSGGKLFWGLFDGGGILAQFRNVGGFSCKPVRLPSE